jgi:hypothetical protein
MIKPKTLAAVSLTAALAAAAAAVGLASSAGAASSARAACGEGPWAATAEGKPAGLARGLSGYYVWHNTSGWHLNLRRAPGAAVKIRSTSPVTLLRSSLANAVVKKSTDGFSVAPAGTATAEVSSVSIDFRSGCARRLSFQLGGASGSSVPVFLGARGAAPTPSFALTKTGSTGVSGQLVVGPTCPVVAPGKDCEPKPTQGTIQIRKAPTSRTGSVSGEVVATVQTDPQGYFSAALASGRYQLESTTPTQGTHPKPTIVDVQAGVMSDVKVLLDTGIR